MEATPFAVSTRTGRYSFTTLKVFAPSLERMRSR